MAIVPSSSNSVVGVSKAALLMYTALRYTVSGASFPRDFLPPGMYSRVELGRRNSFGIPQTTKCGKEVIRRLVHLSRICTPFSFSSTSSCVGRTAKHDVGSSPILCSQSLRKNVRTYVEHLRYHRFQISFQ